MRFEDGRCTTAVRPYLRPPPWRRQRPIDDPLGRLPPGETGFNKSVQCNTHESLSPPRPWPERPNKQTFLSDVSMTSTFTPDTTAAKTFQSGSTPTTTTAGTSLSSTSTLPLRSPNLAATAVPKAALHALYGQAPWRKVISQENYFTWYENCHRGPASCCFTRLAHAFVDRHDSGPPHALKWTSVFCCPSSGEVFPSGRYGDAYIEDELHECNWYNKKTTAEHAAAARAHDCLLYRQGLAIQDTMGRDAPYLQSVALSLPSSTPPSIQQAISDYQTRLRSQMDIDDLP